MSLAQVRWIPLILGLSFLSRFAFLTYPSSVVFDEVHFGKFITAYCCKHEHFFDIHPPHAKLLIAGAAKLFGYDGNFSFENIGQDYGQVPVLGLRIVPALAGSLIPIVIYWLLTMLGASVVAAGMAGVFLALDNAFILQSRIIALDDLLLLWIFLAPCCMWQGLHTKNQTKRALWLLACGAACGFAVGTKLTGLVATAFSAIFWLYYHWEEVAWKDRLPEILPRVLLDKGAFIMGAALIYIGGWYVHFQLLSLPGSGDAFYKPTGEFWVDFMKFHTVMYNANATLSASHPYGSFWWSWPFMIRPIYYWEKGGRMIYYLGNPAVWWGATGVLVTAGLVSILALMVPVSLGQLRFPAPEQKKVEKRKREKKVASALKMQWYPLLCYGLAFLPLMGVKRVLFMYHYMTSLICSVMFAFLWLDSLGVFTGPDERQNRKNALWMVGILLAGFLWMSPLTYGFRLSDGIMQHYFKLFPGWR